MPESTSLERVTQEGKPVPYSSAATTIAFWRAVRAKDATHCDG